jgi:hypothetical protein
MEDSSMNDKKHPELAKSDIIKHLPRACGYEKAAVEFFEQQRWGNSPVCPHCQSANVYKIRQRHLFFLSNDNYNSPADMSCLAWG